MHHHVQVVRLSLSASSRFAPVLVMLLCSSTLEPAAKPRMAEARMYRHETLSASNSGSKAVEVWLR